MTTAMNDGNAQPDSPDRPPLPPRRNKKTWWLVGGALVVVAVIVTVIVVNNSGPSLNADAKLEAGLLEGSDYPSGYTVSLLTQEELDEATGQEQALPDDISPPECAELLRNQPKLSGDTSVGAAKAEGSGTYYVEMITPANGIESWDTGKAAEVVEKCATTTFSQDGQSGTLTMSLLEPPPGDRSFAMKFGIEAEGVTLTLVAAISQVGDHAVAIIGGASGTVDDAEFQEIVAAANEKVERTL